MDLFYDDDPLRSNRAASQQIIETLNLILEPSAFASTPSSLALEKVLYMIQTNLTFDDSGIFYSINCPNPSDRSVQVAFHLWLNNQLVYISSNAQTDTLRQKVVGLQNEMLTASYVKQRWLFALILQNYVLLVRELLTDLDLEKLPHHIRAMHSNYAPSSALDPTMTRIEVKSATVRNSLLESCVKLITHVLPLIVNSDEDLFEQCTHSILLVFDYSNLPLKTQAIHFFSKTFRRRIPSHSSSFLGSLVHKLLQGVHIIRQQIMVWLRAKVIRTKDVERFLAALGFLLGVREFVNLCQLDENRRVAFQLSAYLLQANETDEERLLFGGPFVVAVSDFWKQMIDGSDLMETAGFGEGLRAVFDERNRLNFEPEMVSLLQGLVRDWLNRGAGEECVVLLINQMIGWVDDGVCLKEEAFIDKMRNLNSLIAMLTAADQEWQEAHQQHHFDLPDSTHLCQNCQSVQLTDEWTTIELPNRQVKLKTHNQLLLDLHMQISTCFLETIKRHSSLLKSIESVMEIVEIAWRLLGSRHSYRCSAKNINRLFSLAMATLVRTNQGIQEEYSAIWRCIMQNQKDPNTIDQFHQHLLDTILSRDLQTFTDAMKTTYLHALRNVSKDFWQPHQVAINFHLLLYDLISVTEMYESVSKLDLKEKILQESVASILQPLVCSLSMDYTVVYSVATFETKLQCNICSPTNDQSLPKGLLFISKSKPYSRSVLCETIIENVLEMLLQSDSTTVKLSVVNALRAVSRHIPGTLVQPAGSLNLMSIMGDPIVEVLHSLALVLPDVLVSVTSQISVVEKHRFYDQLMKQHIASAIRGCFIRSDASRQAAVLSIIRAFGCQPGLSEQRVFQTFMLTIFFVIRPESLESKNAALCAAEICASANTNPRQLVCWYKEHVFKLLVSGAVNNFMTHGYGLNKSLTNFCYYMMGNTSFHSTFVPHFSATILALLLPFVMQYPECQQLIDELCSLQNKSLPQVLTEDFLYIYPHICINDVTTQDKCIEYVLKHSQHDLIYHLKQDIRRTLNKTLIWYHRKPEFVMRTLRELLASLHADATPYQNPPPLTKIADYIATRFLGVLTNFGLILIATDLEKSLQTEMLNSLGEIIRFMGSQHVTPFRFKILTILRSASSVPGHPKLRQVCAAVWKIFVYTVDVQLMGPLLSTIVISLEPLMQTHSAIVNEILKYLVISNGSLLSIHINDLFFIEQTTASAEIKEFVARHSKDAIGFHRRLKLFAKQISHENFDVRIYALRYLTELFDQNRPILNEQIIGIQPMSPLIDELLCTLLVGCKHEERNLQLWSGKCLGKMGALEPSHLPPNYAPQKRFAMSIHTDVFSIMALAELCRAYQFQKDTQRVDGFSLAIQEILLARGVCPERRTKMDVWNAIPERMRQLMETLLKSCYTALPSNVSHNVHPIFDLGRFATAEAWACSWASVLIEYVSDVETKHLLKSFKSSIRNDVGILSMFLPYIVMHAIQTCSDQDTIRIVEELQCVFAQVLLDENREFPVKCAKIAFNQLEFLAGWLRQFGTSFSSSTNEYFMRIVQFLQHFDPKILSVANFKCGEAARALQYLEDYINADRDNRLQPELSFLAQIYAELLDSDSLEGALNMKVAKPKLSEQVLLNNATGRLQDSTVCFEQMMQHNLMNETSVVDMIQCYLGLDQPETALMVSNDLIKQMYDQHVPSSLVAACAEPLWRLGRFEELDDMLANTKLRDQSDWGIRCGQVMLALRKGDVPEFSDQIDLCRLSVLQQLRTHDGDERSSYDKVYPMMLRLHQIAEIEMCQVAVDSIVMASHNLQADRILSGLFDEWDARLELLQPTARILEPVLCLRRILLNESKTIIERRLTVVPPSNIKQEPNSLTSSSVTAINAYIGRSLMKSTELARSAEMYQQAQLFLLSAEQYAPVELFIEKAKLYWSKGDQTASLSVLDRGIEELSAKWPIVEERSARLKNAFAEAKFLVATYNADAMNTNTLLNIRYFKEAMKVAGNSEKCYVYYGQYLEKVLAALSDSEQLGPKGNELQQEIMTCYGKSMLFGSRYIYQSMPRFLSIWLDLTARLEANEGYKRVSANMNKIVDRFAGSLPPFVFFTAFSQLVSRICHPSPEVYQVLKSIIVNLIVTFPQQSMWMIMSVYKSSYASRVRRCTEVFSDKRLSDPSILKLINDFNLLAESLIELTNKPVADTLKLTIKEFYRQLPALLKTPGFSPIIMPTNKYMLPVLPSGSQRDRSGDAFNAFPNQAIYIRACGNDLVVMPSLQKPKRMQLIGDDGCDYMIMMKPKDDLRKDFRLMEFNAIVNRYLRQNADTRQRRLYIRTYAVLPLNEECGILEWVDNLQPLRPIVTELLKRKTMGMSSRELRELYRLASTPAAKRTLLTDVLLVRHPPVLADWFKERFTTAHNWYLARSSYVRTTAVISVVGYILGLGDRHGENILFDTSNGDTVHVDFNCLFNKGECFEVPELVPFRLTHNMINAMGPLGVEGLYRKCSQITMRVLQEQMSTLMSVLRPFVYDPLVSWNRTNKTDVRQERTDTQAITNVKRIEERLKGYVKLNGIVATMALSAEGVVNHCISEATDLDKLAVMYLGWAPYI